MNLLSALAAFLLALILVLVGITRIGAWLIERRNPPVGAFATVAGTAMHYVHMRAQRPELPPLVFVHGASGNLKDQMIPFRTALESRAELLFLDRPGHGWSERGPDNETPDGQADTIAALMTHLGIQQAIIVGHSFGAAVTGAFALRHPQLTAGLVFVAPASHPWPGGDTNWYYRLTTMPVIGRLFAETLAYPGASLSIAAASACVFSPNRKPDTYLEDAAIRLLLRPQAFRANAIDVEGLYRHVEKTAPRYQEIAAPTVVISGDRDTVVYEEIHSVGLARDIPGAELVWVRNLGHKPDWIATDLVVAAVEKLAGAPRDLEAAARIVEQRIASDAYAVGHCPDPKPFEAEEQPSM